MPPICRKLSTAPALTFVLTFMAFSFLTCKSEIPRQFGSHRENKAPPRCPLRQKIRRAKGNVSMLGEVLYAEMSRLLDDLPRSNAT
jgi:hypothetical protein